MMKRLITAIMLAVPLALVGCATTGNGPTPTPGNPGGFNLAVGRLAAQIGATTACAKIAPEKRAGTAGRLDRAQALLQNGTTVAAIEGTLLAGVTDPTEWTNISAVLASGILSPILPPDRTVGITLASPAGQIIGAALTGCRIGLRPIPIARASVESVLISGFGYHLPPNACACLWRDSAAGGRQGRTDCWIIDQSAHPFRPGSFDFDANIKRWHLHAPASRYYPTGKMPAGTDPIEVKGYLASGCDAESWLGRCASLFMNACKQNDFGTATTHDCALDVTNPEQLEQLTDWIAYTMSPGACPSGIGAGVIPAGTGSVPPPTTPSPPVLPPAPPEPPAPPSACPAGRCLDVTGLCWPCGTPVPTPTPVQTPVPTPAPPPAPIPPTCPSGAACRPACPPQVDCKPCDTCPPLPTCTPQPSVLVLSARDRLTLEALAKGQAVRNPANLKSLAIAIKSHSGWVLP